MNSQISEIHKMINSIIMENFNNIMSDLNQWGAIDEVGYCIRVNRDINHPYLVNCRLYTDVVSNDKLEIWYRPTGKWVTFTIDLCNTDCIDDIVLIIEEILYHVAILCNNKWKSFDHEWQYPYRESPFI